MFSKRGAAKRRLCAWLLGCAATAWVASGTAARAGKSPSAEQILKNSEKVFKNAKSYEMTFTMSMKMSTSSPETSGGGPAGGMNMRISLHTATVKPNKFLVKPKDPQSQAMVPTIVCDGKKLWTYMPMFNQYTEKPAPPDVSQIEGTGADMASPLSGLAGKGDLSKYAKSARLVGTEKVGGIETYVVELPNIPVPMRGAGPGAPATMPVKVWIGKKDSMVYKFAGTLKSSVPVAGQPGKTQTLQMTMTGTASNVKINTSLPASLFTFKPPQGAQKVEKFPTNAPGAGGPPRGAPKGR